MANNDPYGGGYQGYAGQSYAGYNPFAKIDGKRHPRRLLRTATIFKQIKANSGIHPTIQFARRPL